MALSNCCGASFVGESDLCSDCLEHADEMEEEGCCVSYENGFACTCVKTSYAYTQQAEDDGYGDYMYDLQRDRDL